MTPLQFTPKHVGPSVPVGQQKVRCRVRVPPAHEAVQSFQGFQLKISHIESHVDPSKLTYTIYHTTINVKCIVNICVLVFRIASVLCLYMSFRFFISRRMRLFYSSSDYNIMQ